MRSSDPNGKPVRVFIDIDGTILYEPPTDPPTDELDYQMVCSGLEEFLLFAQEHCEPYWLSFRCRLGKREALETYVLPHLPACAAQIPVAYWDQFKHEALDPTRPFVWFDDYPEPEDLAWLKRYRLSDSLFEMDRTRSDNPLVMLRELERRLAARRQP